MDEARRRALFIQVENARIDEDRAWAVAADVRRRGAPDDEIMSAIHLVEAATAKRMKVEDELRQASQ
jgi:hypothetical protein